MHFKRSHFFAALIKLACTLALYIVGALVMATALCPALLLVYSVWDNTGAYALILRFWLVALSLILAYFLYGFTLILLLGGLRVILRLDLKEGEYYIGSLGAFRWMFINGLYMVVALTFMDFIQLTPFAVLYFRLMGAKVGKNVQINSKQCFDLSLIEIGDNTVIGGYATLMCHSFERGRLILRKVKIGKNVVLGINSVVMAGCQIGEGAFITAGAILGRNKQVAPHSVYAGVPAEPVRKRDDKQ